MQVHDTVYYTIGSLTGCKIAAFDIDWTIAYSTKKLFPSDPHDYLSYNNSTSIIGQQMIYMRNKLYTVVMSGTTISIRMLYVKTVVDDVDNFDVTISGNGATSDYFVIPRNDDTIEIHYKEDTTNAYKYVRISLAKRVATWVDSSGNGNNLAITTTAPAFKDEEYLSFDFGDCEIGGSLSLPRPFTIAMVVRGHSSGNVVVSDTLSISLTDTTLQHLDANVDVSNWKVVVSTWNSGTGGIIYDGGVITTISKTESETSAMSTISLGGGQFDIKALYMYNRSLLLDEVKHVYETLTKKYDLNTDYRFDIVPTYKNLVLNNRFQRLFFSFNNLDINIAGSIPTEPQGNKLSYEKLISVGENYLVCVYVVSGALYASLILMKDLGPDINNIDTILVSGSYSYQGIDAIALSEDTVIISATSTSINMNVFVLLLDVTAGKINVQTFQTGLTGSPFGGNMPSPTTQTRIAKLSRHFFDVWWFTTDGTAKRGYSSRWNLSNVSYSLTYDTTSYGSRISGNQTPDIMSVLVKQNRFLAYRTTDGSNVGSGYSSQVKYLIGVNDGDFPRYSLVSLSNNNHITDNNNQIGSGVVGTNFTINSAGARLTYEILDNNLVFIATSAVIGSNGGILFQIKQINGNNTTASYFYTTDAYNLTHLESMMWDEHTIIVSSYYGNSSIYQHIFLIRVINGRLYMLDVYSTTGGGTDTYKKETLLHRKGDILYVITPRDRVFNRYDITVLVIRNDVIQLKQNGIINNGVKGAIVGDIKHNTLPEVYHNGEMVFGNGYNPSVSLEYPVSVSTFPAAFTVVMNLDGFNFKDFNNVFNNYIGCDKNNELVINGLSIGRYVSKIILYTGINDSGTTLAYVNDTNTTYVIPQWTGGAMTSLRFGNMRDRIQYNTQPNSAQFKMYEFIVHDKELDTYSINQMFDRLKTKHNIV